MLAQRRLMPAWTVFAAATDIGQHVHAALTEPATADAGAVIGRQRNLETAVAVQQRRVVAIALERFGRDHEIRPLGAVLGGDRKRIVSGKRLLVRVDLGGS